MKNLNYRKSFEELLEYPLPPGVTILLDEHDTCVVRSPDAPQQAACLSEPTQCRAALMLIVDRMRAEGWLFTFADHGFEEGEWDFEVVAQSPTNVSRTFNAPDQVDAIAECLIAALGVKE